MSTDYHDRKCVWNNGREEIVSVSLTGPDWATVHGRVLSLVDGKYVDVGALDEVVEEMRQKAMKRSSDLKPGQSRRIHFDPTISDGTFKMKRRKK